MENNGYVRRNKSTDESSDVSYIHVLMFYLWLDLVCLLSFARMFVAQAFTSLLAFAECTVEELLVEFGPERTKL